MSKRPRRPLQEPSPPISRRESVRRIGEWAIYLGALGTCQFSLSCGRTPLGNPFGGDDSSTTPTGTLTPTPTGTGSPTPTPAPCDCTNITGTDTGLLTTDVPLNSIALKPGVFICHDGGGFYAMNSHCTHAGLDIQTYPGSVFNVNNLSGGFLCGHAQSRFNYEGVVIGGPAPLPLYHFRLTVDSNLHLHVDQAPPFPDVTCRCPG